MSIYIQDSKFSKSYTLHEAIISAADKAVAGGGAFAFVTEKGVELLFDDTSFHNVFQNEGFELIVGMDGVTNEKSIVKLESIIDSGYNLNAKAFIHNEKSSIFHPKIIWFKYGKGNGGAVITGSGNFTTSGLRRNREAFVVSKLGDKEIDDFCNLWNEWNNEVGTYLKELDSEEVLIKARANITSFKSSSVMGSSADKEELSVEVENQELSEKIVDDEIRSWSFDCGARILVAEISKNGSRWKQSDFGMKIFTDFFGATPGDNSLRVLLRNVNSSGELGEIEKRQSVSVKSSNYRFELGAAVGDYPTEGRPIGIFIELSSRMFIYSLIFPNDKEHAQFDELLKERWTGGKGKIKRLIFQYDIIKDKVDSLPIAKYLK